MMNLNERTHAIRLVRLIDDNIVEYEAITFPDDPRAGCSMWLRRCAACGYMSDKHTGLLVDILDEGEDIIQEFNIKRRGFEYLRRSLKFLRISSNKNGEFSREK